MPSNPHPAVPPKPLYSPIQGGRQVQSEEEEDKEKRKIHATVCGGKVGAMQNGDFDDDKDLSNPKGSSPQTTTFAGDGDLVNAKLLGAKGSSPLQTSIAGVCHSYDETYEDNEEFSIENLLNFSGAPQEERELDFLQQPQQDGEESMMAAEKELEGDEWTRLLMAMEIVGEFSSNAEAFSRLSFDGLMTCIADLEWLTSTVDDSFAQIPLSDVPPVYVPVPVPVPATTTPTPTTTSPEHSEQSEHSSSSSDDSKPNQTGKRVINAISTKPVPVPSKCRSKRARRHVWSSLEDPPLAEPVPTASGPPSPSNSVISSVDDEPLNPQSVDDEPLNPQSVDDEPLNPQPPVIPRGRGRPPLYKKTNPNTPQNPSDQTKPKKKGRKPKATTLLSSSVEDSAITDEASGRSCTHCGVQKTPQWRAGPMGAKTLCNACGVRYKSGRLVPEYRPANSPTYVDHIHSNSHRKVLEMRRKNEILLHRKKEVLREPSSELRELSGVLIPSRSERRELNNGD